MAEFSFFTQSIICSAHSKNLRNPRIAQRNARILSLPRNPRIVYVSL